MLMMYQIFVELVSKGVNITGGELRLASASGINEDNNEAFKTIATAYKNGEYDSDLDGLAMALRNFI